MAAIRSPSTAWASPAITAAGDTWAVVDTEDGDVWLRGADAVTSDVHDRPVVVGEPDAGGSCVYLADETGLLRVGRGTARGS